jgi:hypothetical protein
MRLGLRACAVVLLVLGFAGLQLAAKRFVMPRPLDAASYPAHDEHPLENVAIAVDPYDTGQKASVFSAHYLEKNLLPMLFVVSNRGGEPVELSGMRLQLVLRDRTKIGPADEGDLYRRFTRTPRNTGISRLPLPLPIPLGGEAGAPKELHDELQVSQFRAREVEPGATESGFFFFDVSGTRKPLAGAHLYVTGVRDSDGNDLMFFDIPLDKYLAASPSPAE